MNATPVLVAEHPGRMVGARLWRIASCDSTNALMQRERDVFRPGDAVRAEVQTAGRGRCGRAWFTAPGALACTLLVTAHGDQPARMPMLMGLGLIRWLATHRVVAQLKWPNDVYWAGRKLAGILSEGEAAGAAWRVRVGIGLNVRVAADEFPPAVRPLATSLAAAGLALAPEAALAELLPVLDAVWREDRAGGWPALRAEAERHLLWRGGRVRVTMGDRTLTGTVGGLAANGGLCVDNETIMAGDVTPLTENVA